jgi:hypothetical protein
MKVVLVNRGSPVLLRKMKRKRNCLGNFPADFALM